MEPEYKGLESLFLPIFVLAPSFPLKVLRFRRCDPLDVNSLTLVLEHNAGSARLSTAYRTDQSDRANVFWHCHTFDHGTFPLQADVQFHSIWKRWTLNSGLTAPELLASAYRKVSCK